MSEDPMIAWLTKTLVEVRARAEAAEADAASPWTASAGLVEASAQIANHRHYGDVGLWDNEGSDTLSMPPKVAEHVASMDPATVLRMVAATEKLMEEMKRWRHLFVEDSYYSCSQARDWDRDSEPPGSGCGNDDRLGDPCDCGLDSRRDLILKIEAERWGWTGG